MAFIFPISVRKGDKNGKNGKFLQKLGKLRIFIGEMRVTGFYVLNLTIFRFRRSPFITIVDGPDAKAVI
jgi:hypothetical protein